MREIEQIIFEEFSNENVANDLEYQTLINDVTVKEEEILNVIGRDKIELIRNLEDAFGAVSIYGERSLIKFVLSFMRAFFK